MKADEIIERACALYFGSDSDGCDHELTRERRNLIKAMLAWGNFCLEAREYADEGDEDARALFEEITQTRLRVASAPR